MRRIIIVLMLAFLLITYLFEFNASAFFSDVLPYTWYAESVQYMSDHSLMNGVDNNRFDPNGTVTRGMLVTILHRLDGADETTFDSTFEDIPAGSYYENAVAWAAAHGIVDGYSRERFGPNDNVTREQLATILYRYSGYKGYDVSKQSALDAYTDSDEISRYALQAMRWSVATGIISGLSDTRLGPSLTASRAQVSAMVMRFDRMYSSETAVSGKPEEKLESSKENQAAVSNQGTSFTPEDNQAFSLTMDHVDAKAGEKDVTVAVCVKNNPGVLGMTLSVRYDDSALILKSAENGEAVSSILTLTNPGKYQSQCRFVWDGVEIPPNAAKDGAILKLHFEIPQNATAGSYPIELFYNNGDIVDNNLSMLTPVVRSGSITVK